MPEDLALINKKNSSVNWLDLITYLKKLVRETKIMSFS